jgi:hypothetical protein
MFPCVRRPTHGRRRRSPSLPIPRTTSVGWSAQRRGHCPQLIQSLRSSAGNSDYQWRRCLKKPTAPSVRSSPRTSPPRAPARGRRSAGNRRTRASSMTWRTSRLDRSTRCAAIRARDRPRARFCVLLGQWSLSDDALAHVAACSITASGAPENEMQAAADSVKDWLDTEQFSVAAGTCRRRRSINTTCSRPGNP